MGDPPFEEMAGKLGDQIAFIRLKVDLPIERKLEGGVSREFVLPASTPLPLTLRGVEVLAEDDRVFPMPALVQGILILLEREELLEAAFPGLDVCRAFTLTMAEDVVLAAERELKEAFDAGNWALAKARGLFLLNLSQEPRRPENARLWGALGFAAGRLGELDKAAAWLRAASALEPDRPETRAELGTTLAKLGRFEEAKAELEAARELRSDLTVVFNLAQVCRQSGRKEEARRWLDEAERLAPDDPALDRLRRDLGG